MYLLDKLGTLKLYLHFKVPIYWRDDEHILGKLQTLSFLKTRLFMVWFLLKNLININFLEV